MIRDPGESFAQVFARPLAELNRSREVLLVWSQDRSQGPAPEATVDNDEGGPETATPTPEAP